MWQCNMYSFWLLDPVFWLHSALTMDTLGAGAGQILPWRRKCESCRQRSEPNFWNPEPALLSSLKLFKFISVLDTLVVLSITSQTALQLFSCVLAIATPCHPMELALDCKKHAENKCNYMILHEANLTNICMINVTESNLCWDAVSFDIFIVGWF